MASPKTTAVSLTEIETLALTVFRAQGCDEGNTAALARTVTAAERDGSVSHGLFRVPGYVASLRSGKVNGSAKPKISHDLASVISVDGDMGYAPLALETGLPVLADAALKNGIAVMRVVNNFHFAALWPETEYLAERGLMGLACTAFKPTVAPAGAKEAFFGTNPLSFAWPRPGQTPLVFDMATSTLAKGDVQIAARDGHDVPEGTGLGPDGQPTNDPAEILKGVLLPFGGYKGSAIAMMVELLCAGMTGDYFSFEAGVHDNNDGGPAKGGELVIAISPQLVAGEGWQEHCAGFFDAISGLDGIRLPGDRRHKNRLDTGPRHINAELIDRIKDLC